MDSYHGDAAFKMIQDGKAWLITALIAALLYQWQYNQQNIVTQIEDLKKKEEGLFTQDDFIQERRLLDAERSADARDLMSELTKLKTVIIRIESSLEKHYYDVDLELDRRQDWMTKVDLFHQRVTMQLNHTEKDGQN